ncbi:MAG: cupin domain-containing protein [Candidatus Bathyarchaeia archaeon]
MQSYVCGIRGKLKMEMQQYFNVDEIDWREFGGITKGVFVKDVSTKTFTEKFNISLFRVKLDGEFPKHKHSHAHVLYFLKGKGRCWIGTKNYQIKPGDVALIRSGEEHGYRNTGKSDLLLVVLNCPATR